MSLPGFRKFVPLCLSVYIGGVFAAKRRKDEMAQTNYSRTSMARMKILTIQSLSNYAFIFTLRGLGSV